MPSRRIRLVLATICLIDAVLGNSPAEAQSARCDIPREARDIWHCENGFVIGPENVIIRLPIPETDPEALYNAGVEAAQREDWRVAIAYFTAAHQRAHLVPRYMYNLGLAHARAGHEVAAIAWLTAYRIAQPATENGRAVDAEIARLRGEARRKIDTLWDGAARVAQAMPERLQPSDESGPQAATFQRLAVEAIGAGNADRARAFLWQSHGSRRSPPPIEEEIAGIRAATRDYAIRIFDAETALSLTEQIGPPPTPQQAHQLAGLRSGSRLYLDWSWPSGYYRGEILDRYDMGDRSGGGAYGLAPHWSLAASGDARGALQAVNALPSNGFFGQEVIGLAAARVGEILLMNGHLEGATQALAIARERVRADREQWATVDRLRALILAEQGRVTDAVNVIEVAASRLNNRGVYTHGDSTGSDYERCCIELGDSLSPQHQWLEFRHHAIAQLVRFLIFRGRTEEGLALADRVDALRRVALLDRVEFSASTAEERARIGAASQAAYRAAAAGAEVSPAYRARIEDAVLTARRLPGAAYEADAGLSQIDTHINTYEQLNVVAVTAADLERALRMIDITAARAEAR